jgi:hypothetical protein
MRKTSLFLLLVGFLSTQAQSPLLVPQLPSPTADGHIGAGEWDAAALVTVPTTAGNSVTVRLLHDGSQLCVAFMGPMESASVLFPELMLDLQLDAAATWQTDDVWFHVSATDCESAGSYADWGDCLAVQPDWTAVPNMTPGGAVTDTIEMLLPFSKLGIAAPDTVGYALCLTNTSSIFKMWPTTANRNNPSTWGTLVLEGLATSQVAPEQRRFVVYPNPSPDGTFWIYGNVATPLTWQLLNICGEEVGHGEGGEFPWQLSGGGGRQLPPGMYVLGIHTALGAEYHKLMVR